MSIYVRNWSRAILDNLKFMLDFFLSYFNHSSHMRTRPILAPRSSDGSKPYPRAYSSSSSWEQRLANIFPSKKDRGTYCTNFLFFPDPQPHVFIISSNPRNLYSLDQMHFTLFIINFYLFTLGSLCCVKMP